MPRALYQVMSMETMRAQHKKNSALNVAHHYNKIVEIPHTATE